MIVEPRISVIMSVFNAQTFLNEAIDSILGQSFQDFEFLIIDDCSTDDSAAILKLYAADDVRIKTFTNSKNLGLTKNLNKLVQISKGEFIARMDADDISLEERFNEQLKFLESNPNIDIVGTFSQDITQEGKIVGERKVPVNHAQIIQLLPTLCPLSHPTVMYRTSAIKKIGGYDERFRTSQDYHLWFKAVGGGLKLHNLPKFLFQYRMNDNYATRKNFGFRWNMFKVILDGYGIIGHPWYKYHYSLLTLGLAFVPTFLFSQVKKLDPR